MYSWKKLVCWLILVSVNFLLSQGDTLPSIIDHPEDIIVPKNSNAELRCKATGSPKPTIYWLRDGKRVPTDNDDPERRRYIMPSGNLTFIRVVQKKKRTDTGKYQCVAVNSVGQVTSKAATLLVGVLRSQFKTEPRDRTITVGNSVTLKCNPPRGKPPPTVAWEKDGVILQPDGKRVRIVEPGSLYISPASKSDQGEYVCQATNPLGQKRSKAARLTVKELPETALRISPKETTVTTGKDITFKCEYRDGPQGAVRWSKKGGTLPLNRFETTQYGELKIKNTQPDDEGEYVCSVSASLSVSAKLAVQTKPSITTLPKDVIVREGFTAKFSCKATGNPLPTVFWDQKATRKTMFPHQNNGRFEVRTNGDLIINNVQDVDEGEYVCSALSQAGVNTASAILTVVGKSDTKPTLKSSPINQTIKETEDASFSCTFDGNPVPTIQWYKDGVSSQSLSHGGKFTITSTGSTTVLKIVGAKQSDSGQYICTGKNLLGSVQGTAQLIVTRTTTTFLPLPITTISSITTKPVVPVLNKVSPPEHLLAGKILESEVLLVWASSKASIKTPTYTIEYRKSGNKKWKMAEHSIAKEKYVVYGLQPDTLYEFSVRTRAGKEQSRRTTVKCRTKRAKRRIVTVNPVVTKKGPARNAKVIVNVEPVKWDKLNITWKFDRHVKKSSSGFNVFWKKENSNDEFEQVPVIGDGVQGHVLNSLTANTSYVIQVQVYFSKHTLPRSEEVVGITGAKDEGIVVILNGKDKQGSEGDVKIIQADTNNGGTWRRVKDFVRKPWFIAIMGGILWIILFVVVLLLYRRRRRNQRQLKQRKLKLQIAEIQRAPTSPQGHKTLWMDDVNTTDNTPPAQLANNRISDTSSTECLNRSVTSCCARRGLNSNTADFPNKITINSLAGSRLGDPNHFDESVESMLPSEGKTNNVHQSFNNYREHLNKSAKFDEVGERASIGSRSGSEATLPRAMPQQTSFLTPTQQFINRKKANTRPESPASHQKDPNKTPDDSSISDKTKSKLKIQSFDMASNGSIPGTTTFHADPPPTYEAVLIETELEKQLEDGEEKSQSREELAEKLKGTPFSDKPRLRPPSPPLSERSCKTTSSCGSRKRKVLKPPPRLAILNWADLLPPPPSHPPPSSLGSPPPSPPFSLRSGMSGMTGMSGLTGMSGMTGLTGMTGMTGRTGKSSANGLGENDIPERTRKKPPSSAVSDSAVSAEPKVPGSTKSGKSGHRHKKPKQAKALPIDLEGITSDIIMQWADSVTNTSGSDDDSSCSSPSRVSSTGSFFTDADFANAVRAAAECGGFNMETYGLMDSLGYPPPYSGSWKRNNPTANGSDPSGPATSTPRGPNNRNKWETGSEGDLEFTPPVMVRPRYTRKVQPNENGTPPPTAAPSKMAADMGIRKVARSPVPIVPSQPRRPVPRAARMNSNSPSPVPGQIVVQPLKRTTALNSNDSASRIPVTKKFAVVKKIPQSKDNEYNSATLSSSGKSSTSTASTVKTSTMGDSDDESAA